MPIPPRLSSEEAKVCLLLQGGLPEPNICLWHKLTDFQDILEAHGLLELPINFLSLALGTRLPFNRIETNRYQSKMLYCLAEHVDLYSFDIPKKQLRHLKVLKNKQ